MSAIQVDTTRLPLLLHDLRLPAIARFWPEFAERADKSPGTVTGALQGLIAGMGFIGGGTILREGSVVRGTATAAVGVAVALGSYDVSIVISAATFLTLRLPKRKILGDPKEDAE